jgi:PST family polysaccharide transporter
MGAGLLVGVWVARYLGPEKFGLLSYATSFVALFGAVASLGLNGVVVQELVKYPSERNRLMGTSFVLLILGGLLSFGIATQFIGYIRPNDATVKTIVILLSSLFVFKATDIIKYWFEAEVKSKYTVWVENIIFVVVSLLKVMLILYEAPLMAFVWMIFLETASAAVGLMFLYRLKNGPFLKWEVSILKAKGLLMDSWPLILSGLAVMAYMRIDQLMLGSMLNDQAVGVYSAAVRVSEVWYFIPIAIAASVFPAIIESKAISEKLYYERLQALYRLMVVMGVSVAVLLTLFSDWLVVMLFGPAYVQSGPILAIHAWTAVFVFIGVASGKWLLIEGLQTHSFYRASLGMVVNVLLNLYLIPSYGVTGAAIATLISQICAAYIADYLSVHTKISFWMKTAALFPLPIVRKKVDHATNSFKGV